MDRPFLVITAPRILYSGNRSSKGSGREMFWSAMRRAMASRSSGSLSHWPSTAESSASAKGARLTDSSRPPLYSAGSHSCTATPSVWKISFLSRMVSPGSRWSFRASKTR